MIASADKAEIRAVLRERRRHVPPAEKERVAREICARLLASSDVKALASEPTRRGALAVYLASPTEIDLTGLVESALAQGLAVVAPRWDGSTYALARVSGLTEGDLRQGPMGILEPVEARIVPPEEVAVWIVPGLAFTRDGRRLGYGGGWYDRLLAQARSDAARLGVGYAFQLVDDLPTEPHDCRLTGVIVA